MFDNLNEDDFYVLLKIGGIAVGAVLLLTMLLYSFHVSPEQIADCVEATGWTEARCTWELNR